MPHTTHQPTFRVEHETADRVYLTGDFNRWNIPGVPMANVAPNRWEIRVPHPVSGIVAAAVMVAGHVIEVMPVRVPANGKRSCIEVCSPKNCREPASAREVSLATP